MTFQSPLWLLALLGVLALVGFYVWVQRRRQAYAARFTNVALLGSIMPKRPAWRRHLAFGVMVLGLATLWCPSPSPAPRCGCRGRRRRW